jgi:hypothetical protein
VHSCTKCTKCTQRTGGAVAIERFLAIARPREGAGAAADVYDPDDEEWSHVGLNRAVYLTSVDNDVVFECDGTGIHRWS